MSFLYFLDGCRPLVHLDTTAMHNGEKSGKEFPSPQPAWSSSSFTEPAEG